MIKVGITGQAGFVGTHLYNTLGLEPGKYERVPFDDAFFDDPARLRSFVRQCDAVVHLAAMNRHPDPQVVHDTNLALVDKLIAALEAEGSRAHVLFSSSTQEDLGNPYGASKREGRLRLERWAQGAGARFTGMVVPNVFGPFGRPDYNSFVATFCHKLTHGEEPQVMVDNQVRLIYVGSLARHILAKIDQQAARPRIGAERDDVPHDLEMKVTEILALLRGYKRDYLERHQIPALATAAERDLFNTFRCYIDPRAHFPAPLEPHADARGVFVETLRLGGGGQVSFSTTRPGVTRGNHYHTRKIERFTVIKGQARIELRRVGTDEVIAFELDGSRPAHVDMPIWYTHNITNIGSDDLYTQFWINEFYDPADGDTYFEQV